ncbi:hypothetical protein G6F37_001805 [Rhizopus arrhizus]|nr:hypothetical protein G6F38_009155 [Rhizopus arrhizus]KAG1162814.1 hypothetical protein G6F37_001805 [Rhizopus arrhizus]
MEVGSEQFPLGDITDFDTYMDLKPPERGEKAKEVKTKVVVDKSPDKRDYTRRSSEKENNFFKIIYEKDYKVPQAAEEDPTQQEEKKRVGRLKILNDERKQFLLQKYVEYSRATVSEAVESLTTQFMGLKIAKSAVHDFMTNECASTIKRAHFEPKKETHQTVSPHDLTGAVVVQPKTKAKTTTILGAISSQGIIKIKVRVPYEQGSKKRKVTRELKAKKIVGAVLDHYFNFISVTLDVLDRHEQFKGHYLIMDNAPVHNSDQIMNLIFWSVVKSKMKREKLLKEENLTTRVTDACNNVFLEDLQGFCRYSDSKLQTCLNKEPL